MKLEKLRNLLHLSDTDNFKLSNLLIFISVLDVDGRIILRWVFRKWEGVVGNEWSRLRIGRGGGHL